MIDVGIASAAIKVERKLHKKQKNDDRREDRAEDQMLLDRTQRILDKDRVVADDTHLVTLWQRCFDLFQRFDLAGDGDGILAGLFRNDQRDGRLAVQAGLGADLFAAVLGVAEVLDLYLITAAGRDDHVVKPLGFLYFPDRSDGRFCLALVEPAARKLHILDL